MSADPFVVDRLPPAEQQPEFRFDLPELDYPERLNAAVELLRGGAPEDIAILNAAGQWSYRELDALSDRIAHVLVEEEGLVPGNRVLLAGRNGAMLFACWLAILKAGGIVVALMPILRGKEFTTVCRKAAISHALVDAPCLEAHAEAAAACDSLRSLITFDGDTGGDELARRIARAPTSGFAAVDTAREDPAIIAFTSGTTGEPKGCVHDHRAILAPCDTFARHVLRPARGQRWACTAPLAFTFGLGMQYLFPLRFGGTAVTPAAPGPEGLLEAIEAFEVNICATAPTAYRALLGQLDGRDIGSLVTCVSAGEHLPAATWHAWHEATGLAIVDGIGATELMHIFIAASGADIRPGATGKAVPGYTATVLDEDGAPLAHGTGRLAIKGPTGCRYLDDPRQADYVVAGWNVTGDTYRKDEDGYFWYLARSDDMIISSGYNIAGPEVEIALGEHPAVLECAVIGAPCPERGQRVEAHVVLAPGHAADAALVEALQAHVKRTIAPYKYPRAIHFVDSLPKTPTGKLRRAALRAGD
ncbi:AMP-binding protein [Sphingomicrobium astaxanthinifaciens]|uniref:AMP-binding protein n=1 Tax=Sphingomicrobium astaxanthinifaciens TaxID=1227949 RepID=UPI001FCAFA99|nr:AMP-binding protein [Sphingomicrobium astaxanthinifaciens]MCJ7420490.1 AMP-binding protein [Sphingomicrobium astaxanthinifaciens]